MLRLSKINKFNNIKLQKFFSRLKTDANREFFELDQKQIDLKVFANGGVEIHNIIAFKNVTSCRNVAMKINYMHANNNAIAIYRPKIEIGKQEQPRTIEDIIKEESQNLKAHKQSPKTDDYEFEEVYEDINDNEELEKASQIKRPPKLYEIDDNSILSEKILSMHDTIPADGHLEFINFKSLQHHLSEDLRPNYKLVMDEINSTFHRSCQILLLKALKRAMPEGVEIESFRRPEYKYSEAPAFSYDVKIKNGDFLKNANSNNNDEISINNVLNTAQLLILNKFAREIISEKIKFEVIKLSRNDCLADLNYSEDVLDFMESEDITNLKLVKIGNHIEVLKNNHICLPNTSFIKHFSVTRMTHICDLTSNEAIYRIQGAGSPTVMNPEVFRILEKHANNFVFADLLDTIDKANSYNEKIEINGKELENKFVSETIKNRKIKHGLPNIDLNPLFRSLESQIKFVNSSHFSSLDRWLKPTVDIKFSDLENEYNENKYFVENLKSYKPLELNSIGKIQAKEHRAGYYGYDQDKKKEYLYQPDSILYLGMNNGDNTKTQYSDPEHKSIKRAIEHHEAFLIMCMIGGPINRSTNWYRRRFLDPRAIGRWSSF